MQSTHDSNRGKAHIVAFCPHVLDQPCEAVSVDVDARRARLVAEARRVRVPAAILAAAIDARTGSSAEAVLFEDQRRLLGAKIDDVPPRAIDHVGIDVRPLARAAALLCGS
eukprot:7111098-Prymnesium_polylepis.1